MTKLSNTIYNTGEWPQDFTEVTMIALKKKTKATKCSDYRTISLIAHSFFHSLVFNLRGRVGRNQSPVM